MGCAACPQPFPVSWTPFPISNGPSPWGVVAGAKGVPPPLRPRPLGTPLSGRAW